MSVKLLNATVDIFRLAQDKETVIIRGIVDPDSLGDIKVAPYQREAIPGVRMNSIKQALKVSTVPDVELGMRGDNYRVHEGQGGEGDTYYLQDPVFVIDGLQRISGAKAVMGEEQPVRPRIGAVIHVGTTVEWEAERFRILNQDRLRLNANVLLRNARAKSPAIDMIFRLTEDPEFMMHKKVQWSQRKTRTELTTALVICQVAGFLHSRFGPGRGGDVTMVSGLDKIMKKVGRTTMRDNLKTFFDILEECFGVRRIVYGHSATVLRIGFLISLCDLFMRHSNFWRGNRLFVEKDLKMKLAKFPIQDPEVVRLASSSGKAKEILYQLILDHINSGKRSRRLTLFDGIDPKKDTAEVEKPGIGIPRIDTPIQLDRPKEPEIAVLAK